MMVRLTTGACIGALDASHDTSLVILSVVVAAVASFAALTLTARARSGLTRRRNLWLLAASLALGGGIWTMHFVAMLAFRLPLAIAYDPLMTIVSMLVAVVVVAGGVWLVDRAEGNWRAWLAAGPIVGAGVALMHYTGMYAMRMQAVTLYDTSLFIASIVIAVVAATAALAIAFTVRAIWLRCVAALVMAAAIAGMHYTGMAAAQFVPDPSLASVPDGVDRFWLAVAIGIVFLACSFLAMASVWIEHRLAQREAATVRRSERRFRALLQHATDVVLLLDRDGRVRFESGPVELLLGMKPGALTGRRIGEAVPDAAPLETLEEQKEQGGAASVRRFDLPVALADGTRLILDTTVQDAFHEPELRARLVQLHDVTATRLAAEKLAAARDAAQRGERAKSEFLGSISHELRTPIHVALGFAEMLRENADRFDTGQVAEFAGEIHSSIDRLMHIVGDLIELSRLEAEDLLDEELVDPNSLLHAAARRLQTTATRARLTFEVDADGAPPVLVDERKMAYALWHLLGNAIKFSDSGSVIRLIASVDATGELRLVVQDRGIGMSQDEIARATDSFTQADGSFRRNAEGLGLGLSLARRIAERHGGRLELESSEGVGTRVSILLPADRVRRQTEAA